MDTVEDFSRLSGIYAAAAVTPQHWERGIHDIHRTIGGTGCSLLTADGAASPLDSSSPLLMSPFSRGARMSSVALPWTGT